VRNYLPMAQMFARRSFGDGFVEVDRITSVKACGVTSDF
jgi:hypothetical protein